MDVFKYLFICWIVLTQGTLCQKKSLCTVSGVVKDKSSNLPIENVNVHIINSLNGGATSSEGFYEIKNLPCGEYKIIASCVGYYHKVKNISIIENEHKKLNFYLDPKTYELETVKVIDNEDDEWVGNFEVFKREFIGETENAGNVRIKNYLRINFSENKLGNLTASIDEPLEIYNDAIGYKILYFLEDFEYDNIGSVKYSGYPVFEELTTHDLDVLEEWKENRYETYIGSFRHFIKSLSDKYMIQASKPILGESGEIDKKDLDKFIMTLYIKPPWHANNHDYRITTDMLSFLSEGILENELKLSFEEYLQIRYKKNFRTTLTSTLKLHSDTVTIDKKGRYHDEFKIQRFGYWATQRIADMLPLDYQPNHP